MKYITALLLTFTLFSQSHAGLFEYTQWEKTRINATKYESSDVIESLKIPSSSYSYSSSVYDSYNSSKSLYKKSVKPTIFADDYYSYTYSSSTNYNTDDIIEEMNYYISLANWAI